MICDEENIAVGLCNLTTYVFKGHVNIVKIYMVNFNVSVFNGHKYKLNT